MESSWLAVEGGLGAGSIGPENGNFSGNVIRAQSEPGGGGLLSQVAGTRLQFDGLRGQIVAAIDMRERLALPKRTREQDPMNMIVRAEGALAPVSYL